jgi:citrate synthase
MLTFYFIFQVLGFLVELLPVLFAIGRMAGWLAQWREGRPDAEQKIACPRPIYVGEGLIHLRPRISGIVRSDAAR